MKLRIRCQGRTIVSTLADCENEEAKLCQLKQSVEQLLNIADFHLSLNGKDPVLGGEETSLKDLGIVSGDLVHVLTSQAAVPPSVQQPQQSLPSTSANSRQSNENNVSSTGACSAERNANEPGEPTKQDELYSRLSEPSCSTSGQNAPYGVDMEFPEDEDAVQDAEVNRYLNEPTLVRDSTDDSVPQSLHKAFQDAPVENASDALVVVLHVLMVETGYQSTLALDQGPGGPYHSTLPSGWKCGSTYRVTYKHPSCPDVEFGLTAVPMGSNLIVHGLAKGTPSPIHCQLSIKTSTFVKKFDSDPLQIFHSLPKLSRLFKDKVAHLLLQKAAEALDIPFDNELLGLIFELKIHVLKFLDARSLCQVAGVCKELKSLAYEPVLWRRLYLRVFGRRTDNDLSQDWRQLYREKYVLRQRMRRDFLRSTIVVPPDLGRPNPPFPFAPVYPPGFIGGDYDRDPDFAGIPGPLGRGNRPNPMFPRPRFDPIGPLRPQRFPPGRGGGIWESGRPRHSFGGFGPTFF